MSVEPAGLSRRDGFDLGLAVVITALSYSLLLGSTDADVIPAWVLATLHALPIAARRRFPRAAFAVSALAGLAFLVLGYDMIGLGIAVLITVYSLAAETPRRHSLIGLGAVALAFVVIAGTSTALALSTVVVNLVGLITAWFLGDSSRRRREQALLEQEMRAEQAVVEERLRIARELHDVVAHSMSVVTVQAGMARMVLDDDPEKVRRSLLAIERAGHQAMDEMRRLLLVLRDDRHRSDSVALAPTPGLQELYELLDEASDWGASVELDVVGEARDLGPGVELAAFRVVQEAMSNIRKHAPGSPARVRIEFSDAELLVSVGSDLGVGSIPGPAGHGITGMRERVELYRGRLETTVGNDRTFLVTANIPYRDPSS